MPFKAILSVFGGEGWDVTFFRRLQEGKFLLQFSAMGESYSPEDPRVGKSLSGGFCGKKQVRQGKQVYDQLV